MSSMTASASAPGRKAGRPPIPDARKVSVILPGDVWSAVESRQTEIQRQTGVRLSLSQVLVAMLATAAAERAEA